MENQSSSSGFFPDSLVVDVQRQRLDKENCEECLSNSEKVKICAKKKFPRGQWTFLGQGEDEKSGMERTRTKLRENGIQRLLSCWTFWKKSGQPTFRGSFALNRGVLKRKGGRCTNQLTAESTDTELLFRSSNSANQLSIKNGRCSKIIEKSKIRVSRHVDSSTTTQMAKIMVQYGRPSRFSWTKSVRSSFWRTVMGKAVRESSIGTRLGKSSELGMFYSMTEKKDCSCLYAWTTKLAGKKQNIDPMWEILINNVNLAEPTLFLQLHHLSPSHSPYSSWLVFHGWLCTQTTRWIWANLVNTYHGVALQHPIDPRQMAFRREWYAEYRKGTSAVLLQSGSDEKVVVSFNGMLLLSAKRPRPPRRQQNSVRKTISRTIQRANNTFWSNSWISPVFTKRLGEDSPIWQESATWNLSWIWADCGRGWSGKEISW